jgi:hypothetical protein
MKIGEILRQLADYADAQEAKQGEVTTSQAPDLDAQAGTGESPDEVYVGPLQQKHELLKKATGVENNVEKFADDDELTQMQTNAGIQPTTVINQTIEVNPSGQTTTTSTPVQSTVPAPVAAITMPAIADHNDID